MLRQYIMWALICTAAPFVCADEPAIDLNEITVTASPVIDRNDRKVIRPDRETTSSSTDGIDLLRRLKIPWITVSPLSGEITIPSGGSVILCVNGVESTPAQIAAIRPKDVVRIEYHDTPGMRYAGASAVIDYITVRHDTGGNISMDAFGAMARGRYASIDHFAGQYDDRNSSWRANIGFMGQRKDRWIRDYDETWHYPDAILTRHETGLPVTVGGIGLESALSYDYLHPGGDRLQVRLGLDLDNTPDKEEGDRKGLLHTSDTDTPVMVTEHTAEHSVRPGIGLYGVHRFTDNSNLTVDLQGSYIHSRMLHEYSEDGIGESSRVKGDKYALRFLGIYENRIGSRAWSIGITANISSIHNAYILPETACVNVRQSEGAVAGEYSDRLGNWGIVCNLRASYRHLGQRNSDIDGFFLHPSVNISYRPAQGWFMRYSASVDHVMPSASEISDVSQPVQTGMIRRGNPSLRPFRVTRQSFTASVRQSIFSIEGKIEYRDEHRPVMESVLYEQGIFVRTYLNQRSFRTLSAGASLSLHPWNNHISITVQPLLTRYFSHGTDYRHTHSIFRMGLSVDFTYGHWLAYGNIMSGPANRMYGEEIIEEKDMNQIMAGCRGNGWSAHIGVFNAFVHDYSMETRNLSALTPYTSLAHSGRSSSYLALRFSLDLEFGRKQRDISTHGLEPDSDTGILSGNK